MQVANSRADPRRPLGRLGLVVETGPRAAEGSSRTGVHEQNINDPPLVSAAQPTTALRCERERPLTVEFRMFREELRQVLAGNRVPPTRQLAKPDSGTKLFHFR